ncbi:MAG: transcriptional regulator [Actinobacteria bacterium ATB1]|nr:transcriptional regulator [Actinobacteria bacterium ATB1]
MAKTYELDCPVARSLEIVGERWTLLIIRELLLGHSRFGEFSTALPGIPPNLLSDRLRLLEAEGIVERLEPKGYSLTVKGRSLAPALGALAVWGMRYYEEPPSALARHARCGGRVRGHWTCDACGDEVSPDDLELVAPEAAPQVSR